MQAPPILVTGAHRSGTTWVGQVLSVPPEVAYLHEPLNLTTRPGICAVPKDNWYPYIESGNEAQYFPALQDTIHYRYNVAAEIGSSPRLVDLARLIRDLATFSANRYFHKPRVLIKDPFALFSAAWFEKEVGTRNVILIRHPAAFISSILKKGWAFPFQHWLNQPNLIENLLSPFRQEIELHAKSELPLIDQAILLWNSIHYVISGYQKQYPDWLFVKHEALCEAPKEQFRSLYQELDLPWTSQVESYISSRSSSENPIDPIENTVFDIHRNSKSVISVWKDRLTKDQIDHIRQKTEAVYESFYGDADWQQ